MGPKNILLQFPPRPHHPKIDGPRLRQGVPTAPDPKVQAPMLQRYAVADARDEELVVSSTGRSRMSCSLVLQGKCIMVLDFRCANLGPST